MAKPIDEERQGGSGLSVWEVVVYEYKHIFGLFLLRIAI